MKNRKKVYIVLTVLLLTFFIGINNVFAEDLTNESLNPNQTVNGTEIVRCGGLDGFGIPAGLPNFTRGLYNTIKIMVPIVIIVLGILDFAKASMASKEQDMKEYQNKFIRRLIAGVAVFFILTIVNFAFSQTKLDDSNGFLRCLSCLSTKESACDTYILDSSGAYTEVEKSKCLDLNYNDCNMEANCSWNNEKCEYNESKPECQSLSVKSFSERYDCNWTGSSCEYNYNKVSCSKLGINNCSNRTDCTWNGSYCVNK